MLGKICEEFGMVNIKVVFLHQNLCAVWQADEEITMLPLLAPLAETL